MVFTVQWMVIQTALTGIMFNKIFFLLLFLITSNCSTNEKNFTPLTHRSLTNIIEVENPVFATLLLNKYLLYSNKLPDEALKKHNAAIHTALMDVRNGVVFYWEYKKTKGIDKLFSGKLKIVNTTNDNRGICRTWIEEISRDRRYLVTAVTTACLSKDKKKYILADEFFYDKL